MTLPGGLATFVLVLFALAIVLLLGFRGNDGSLLGDGFHARQFRERSVRSALLDRHAALARHRRPGDAGDRRHRLSRRLLSRLPRRPPTAGSCCFWSRLPFWTSYLLRVFAWKIVLAYNGVLNSALLTSGLTSEPILAFLNTPAAVVVTLAHAYARLRDPADLRGARDDPAIAARGGVRSRRPALRQPSAASCCRCRCRACSPPRSSSSCRPSATIVTPALVGGPSSTMIGTLIQAQFGKANDWPFGAALSVARHAGDPCVVLVVRFADRRFGSRT